MIWVQNPVYEIQNKGKPQRSTTRCEALTFYVQFHWCTGCLLPIKFSCAGDLSVVVLLLGNERQDGLCLPVARMKLSVTLSGLFCGAPAPCEYRHMRGTCVDDWTSDSVGMSFSGCLWVNQWWLWRISCKYKRPEVKQEANQSNIERWWYMKVWKVGDILSMFSVAQSSMKENLSGVGLSLRTSSIRKQKGPLSWFLTSVISKVQLFWPNSPNKFVRPRKFSRILVLSSW